MALRHHQEGVALLVALLILLLATAFVATGGNLIAQQRVDSNNAANQQLAQARDAVIAYALSRPDNGERPGNLPFPDTLSSAETPANYDGKSDGCFDSTSYNATSSSNAVILNGANMRCLGRLPWQSMGISLGADIPENDPQGVVPWLAVSANLLESGCLNALNPGTLQATYSAYQCNTTGALPHPWLTVRDRFGNVLSNRVAFVLILPGPPLPGQNRSSSPSLGNADHYLDTLTVTTASAGCTTPPCTFSNANLDNDFIIADDSRLAGTSPSGYASPYQFNDRVLYVTIDELMRAISSRVAGEARKYVSKFKATNGYLPYAGNFLGANCTLNTQGALPLPTCIYDGSTNFRCTAAGSYTLTLPSGQNFTSATGACSAASNVCTCSGAGQCTKTGGANKGSFVCDGTGSCNLGTLIGTVSFQASTGTVQAYAGCTTGGSDCSCIGTGYCQLSTGSCNDAPALAAAYASSPPAPWFVENEWHRYVFYAASSNCVKGEMTGCGIGNLILGASAPQLFVIGNAGPPFAGQTRPSNSLANYLDDAGNQNGDASFVTPSNTSNDQLYATAP